MQSLISYVNEKFKDKPAKLKVAKLLMFNGLSVKDKSIFCNEVEVPYASVARAAGVDQRVVKSLIEDISSDGFLSSAFSKFRATLNLVELAPALGYGVVEITAVNPKEEGIVAAVASAIASEKLSIKQVISEDPELFEEPKLYIITDGPIPEKIIGELKKIGKIKSITIY